VKYPLKHVLVCNGERCNDEKHGPDRGECIRAELKDLNKKLGRKPTVRVCSVSCLDLCDYGPNMIIEGTVYSHLDVSKAMAAYSGEMGDGPKRPDLELREDEMANR
jgi:NADH:ubiquinone oxidoreductase subunit E